MKNEIIFIGKIDPYNSTSSGVRGYVLGLCKAFRAKRIKTKLIGHSSIRGTNENFVNIVSKKDVPEYFFTLKLYAVAVFYKFFNKIQEDTVVHPQRADYALPFIFFKNPLIFTMHGKTEQAKEKHGLFVYIMFSQIEKIVMKNIDAAIAVSEDIKDYYINKYPYLKEKITVIHNGVDIFKFRKIDGLNIRTRYNLSIEEKIILYIGRLHPEKNITLLLESFSVLKEKNTNLNVRLIIVGNGESKNDLVKYAKDLNIVNDILFFGTVNDSDIPEIINCADVFALTSIIEGFPLVILESLACGVPVVSTNAGDVAKVVINSKTGFIVENYSSVEFASKLELVLTSDKDFSIDCIKIAECYSWNNVAAKTLNVYNDFCKKIN